MASASYYDQSELPYSTSQHPSSTGQQYTDVTSNEKQAQAFSRQEPIHQPGQPQQPFLNQQDNLRSGLPQQHTGPSSHGQGPIQQMNGHGEQAATSDNRDTLTKWLEKIEKKFGGERFKNPDNAEKNQSMNENILKRFKQVGKLVMQRGPGMVMRMVR